MVPQKDTGHSNWYFALAAAFLNYYPLLGKQFHLFSAAAQDQPGYYIFIFSNSTLKHL